jgi:hypothetical protein
VIAQGTLCPTGWSGETAMALSNMQPGCAAGCTCSNPSPGTCTPGDLTFDGQCPQGGSVIDVSNPDSDCNNVFASATVVAQPPEASTETCTPAGGGLLPIEQVVVCKAPPGAGCDGGSCTPPPAGGRLCLVVADQRACPGDWQSRELHPFEADPALCVCTCDPAIGSCSNPTLVVHGNPGCSGGENTAPTDGSCFDPVDVSTIEAFEYGPGTWQGTCAAHQGPDQVSFGSKLSLCCVPE